MKRVRTLCLVAGAALGLAAAVGCEEGYDDDATIEGPGTAEEYTPPPAPELDTEAEEPVYTDRETVPPPATPEVEAITYTGVLQSGGTDELGETTGWLLIGTSDGDLQVDVSAVTEDATALDGTQVKITGALTERQDELGNPIRIVMVDTIEPAG